MSDISKAARMRLRADRVEARGQLIAAAEDLRERVREATKNACEENLTAYDEASTAFRAKLHGFARARQAEADADASALPTPAATTAPVGGDEPGTQAAG